MGRRLGFYSVPGVSGDGGVRASGRRRRPKGEEWGRARGALIWEGLRRKSMTTATIDTGRLGCLPGALP